MVRELHRAGIEVILDVVFNHTGEGGADGPILSFRGLDNDIYYMLTSDGARYLDYTGCGNTLNCNHPVVRSMIIDCLRHWVVHFHIDGFRFDLAAVLGRGEDGSVLVNAPVLEEIAEDPILRNVKLIAEAWDSGGAFEVGRFAGARWGEWNCHFRDHVRRFWRGDPGFTGAFASRFCGSADLYEHDGQTPIKTINFVTSHDGFTLSDLVSYADKHNERNGEQNRDGLNENYSANYGVEGPTSDPAIRNLRFRHMKNVLATLLLARGVPMLLGGDEFGRTQLGNNNAYCQDNEVSWYDWTAAEENASLVRFVQRVIALRQAYAVLRAERFYSPQEIKWMGPFGQLPEWQGAHNRIGCVIRSDASVLALLFNATTEPCEFDLPDECGPVWQVCIDTSCASPDDAPDEWSAPPVDHAVAMNVAPQSVLVLRGSPRGQTVSSPLDLI
jgi:glycogen operon protein